MNGESSRYDDKLESMLQDGSSEPHDVPLEYLKNITNNFSDERRIGQGGFGTVYKGVLQNGEMIAVKKFNSSLPGDKDRQFDNEASHLMRLKHPNVVLLKGWCSETEYIPMKYNGKYICAEKSERLLCLEYMPKGNLRGYISDEISGLGWDTRYKIIEGICYGLRYLHEECQINAPTVHMDLKPANILLDNNMVPKIADFGLSRLFSEEKTWTCTRSCDGTLGYMSPEHISRGIVSRKSDIFSLGVIIIEIVTGRRDYPDDTGTPSAEFIETVLHNWIQRKGTNILSGIDYQQIRRCIQIGLDCVKTDRSKRPTISQIIKALHRPEVVDSSNIKRDGLESMVHGGSSRPHNLPLKYLRVITNNFSDERLLGKSDFGTVYKGVLQNGEMIAVKKLNSSIPGVKDRQFESEVNHLMRLKHRNVVLLVGWCSEIENIYVEYNGKYMWAEKSARLLCLEYMPKGNLRGYLSDEFSGLDWDTRYKIIEGICYGLRYLHEECQLNAPIVHMDLKPANILLDNNMVPKIADFRLSRNFSEEKTKTDKNSKKTKACTSRNETLGYMSPEYINRGIISEKSDIFSLGVIIIEVVTGRRTYPDETGISSEEFIEMVLNNWSQRKSEEILIGHVSLEVHYQQIRRCIQIGLDCVKIDRFKRPTISKIIKILHGPECADSRNIKGVHRPQSGKRERSCGETSRMERLAKKHTPGFSIFETSTVALHQSQNKTALRRIRVIFTTAVFVVLLKKRVMQRRLDLYTNMNPVLCTNVNPDVLGKTPFNSHRDQ